jgi:LPXTG-motif cell wall-anchored protein
MTRSTPSRGARLGRRLALLGATTAAATTLGVAAFGGVSEAQTPEVAPSVPADTTLPVTGSASGLEAAIALASVSAGTALVVVVRRRRRPSVEP